MTDMAIRYRGVSKVYPDGTTAVDDLNLDVPAGSLTVFVGPSGCGKTTSLRMLNRMVEPSSGTVEVNGQDVASIPAAKLRRSMGYVMQQSGLLPHKTVEDNIATVPVLTGVSRREARARAAGLDVVVVDAGVGEAHVEGGGRDPGAVVAADQHGLPAGM